VAREYSNEISRFAAGHFFRVNNQSDWEENSQRKAEETGEEQETGGVR
jgi:hypothetical protein